MSFSDAGGPADPRVGQRTPGWVSGPPDGWRQAVSEWRTMSEPRTATPATPWHLWFVGIVGLLWSLMGVVSFVLTQMRVEAVMSQFPPQQREYFESFPLWAVALWAIGVFSGLIGCVLLLLKKRLAVGVLSASIIGTSLFLAGGLFLLGGMKVMQDTDGLVLATIPVFVAAGLTQYAAAMSKRGVLGQR